MTELSGFPSAEVQFDRDAGVVGGTEGLLRLVTDPTVTDLMVVSHGWNNDMTEARQLFSKLAASLRGVLDAGSVTGLGGRSIAIAGLLWPSKKFADTDLVPGGAAAAASPIDAGRLLTQIEDLRDLFPDPAAQQTLDTVAALVPALRDKSTARTAFADELRSLLNRTAADPEDATTDLFGQPGGTIMDRLAIPVSLAPPRKATGGAAALGPAADASRGTVGGAAGLGSLLGGVMGAARNLLNFTTYYEMKTRSGRIGEQGLAPVIAHAHRTRPELRVHLVGHSFGGRLVSATAKALPDEDSLSTLTLLQAAFSHYGFAENWTPGQSGFFRTVVSDKKVTGPVLITDTANDLAVGIAYAIASRIAGQVAAAVGDADDIYGGMGRNGAQKTPEAISARLLDTGGQYTWKARALHNLLADRFITGHSDVTGLQVAYALLSALSTT
ncbi:hypothetical protein J2W56_000517 [Nocardia kruczakiae]|uniref:Uncharacterized protein n=1 Tax=Nocardia kruczakiae TaxID=261477 RepID=A0ABU1X8D1_9NOCA|nr:hypothetical protein [Nocardia kruczakiae]MDR7166799.1 hypothetical protein [Nocardia kruczakiae]